MKKIVFLVAFASQLFLILVNTCTGLPSVGLPSVALPCAGAYGVVSHNYSDFDKLVFEWCSKFAHVVQLVKQKHYQVSDLEKAWTRSLDAFLNYLDPHSSLLFKDSYNAIMQSTSGEFFGIGVVIDNTRKSRDKVLTIIETIAQGPADSAGIKNLDKIVDIDGIPVEGMTTEEIIAKLKGPRNTTVTIRVLRDNSQDLLTYDVTRDIVRETSTLSFSIKNYNICYIALTVFNETAAQHIEKILKKAITHPYKGIILDLRNNSGGLLSAVVDIAGFFVPSNSLVVQTKNKDNVIMERYYTKKQPLIVGDTPIFILINNYTASAAEILAGYLVQKSEKMPHGMPPICTLGTQSFGKGSVQEIIPLDDGCAIKLTTAIYCFPDGSTVQGKGITPDFSVDRSFPASEQMQWFLKNYGRESSLENCIGVEKGKAGTKELDKKNKILSWTERAKQMLQTDNQVRECIMLINHFSTMRSLCPKQAKTRKDALAILHALSVSAEPFIVHED